MDERRLDQLLEQQELMGLVAARAGAGPGHEDPDAVAREIARVARPDDIQPLGRLAGYRAERFAERLHPGAILGRAKSRRAGEELHFARPRLERERLQLTESGVEIVLGQDAAVDLDLADIGHDVGVLAAADLADAERALLPRGRASRLYPLQRVDDLHHSQDRRVPGVRRPRLRPFSPSG